MTRTSKILATLIAVAAAFGLNGCGAPQNISTRGDLDSLVFDPSAQNVALLLGSDGGNLDGVPVDIRGLKELFGDTSNGFNFSIQSEERNASVRMASQMLKQAAAQVGERGTLLIYYSGHGAQGSGCMAFTDDCITFKTFAQAIQEVRTTPIKRLLFFSDSCFSGQLVTGNSSIISGGGSGSNSYDSLELSSADLVAQENVALTRAGDDWYTSLATSFLGGSQNSGNNGMSTTATSGSSRGFEKTLFEQALTVAAARPNETSADLGAGGGAFTSALRRAFSQLKGSTGTTIRQFLDKTAQDTQRNGHTPVYRAFPSDVVLADTLTGATTGGSQPMTVSAQTINMLLNQSPDANASIWGAADISIASMTICNGDRALCSAANRDDIILKKATASEANNRSFFHSDKALTLSDGYIFTLQGKDASGKSIVQRTVRIAKQ